MRNKAVKIGIVVICILALLLIYLRALGSKTDENQISLGSYQQNGMTETQQILYGNKNVMVIVPHEDDDLNLMAGILEEYKEAGSDVRVVFVTNGDKKGMGETRLKEAHLVLESYKIPKENIVFLGYGDQWNTDYQHIYYAPDDEVITSYAGYTKTYGTEGVKPYKNRTYTRAGIVEDLKDVILQYQPDTIFCSDYDTHCDHRAVSFLFEEAMGKVLKENKEYTPQVYKGFAYFQAWNGPEEFYSENIPSAHYEDAEAVPYNPVYLWKDRVRFPVSPESLSRKLEDSRTCQALSLYASQNAVSRAAKIIKGDKVFWNRRTDNAVIHGKVNVSSGDASVLNDFKLVDSSKIMEQEPVFDQGSWCPKETDHKKQITVNFIKKEKISELVLYDNPSLEDNILNTDILLSDGTKIKSGALKKGGAPTRIILPDEKQINGFTIQITDYEGKMPGLTEIEAYPVQITDVQKSEGQTAVKLMDRDENFAYDYWTDKDGKAEFSLYSFEEGKELNLKDTAYDFCIKGRGAHLKKSGNKILVQCKTGARIEVEVLDKKKGVVMDRIYVSNPKNDLRRKLKEYQKSNREKD